MDGTSVWLLPLLVLHQSTNAHIAHCHCSKHNKKKNFLIKSTLFYYYYYYSFSFNKFSYDLIERADKSEWKSVSERETAMEMNVARPSAGNHRHRTCYIYFSQQFPHGVTKTVYAKWILYKIIKYKFHDGEHTHKKNRSTENHSAPHRLSAVCMLQSIE